MLVLASGGVLGEAWMSGLLAGIEDATAHDFRRTEAFVGTSAGSLVAAALAAGQRPRRPDSEEQPGLRPGGGDHLPRAEARIGAAWRARPRDWPARSRGRPSAGAAATAPLAPAALAVGAPGGAALRAALLARAPDETGRSRRSVNASRPAARASMGACGWSPSSASPAAAWCSARPAHRRRRSERRCRPRARCRGSSPPRASASGSTSTAASGAARTSTSPPPVAAPVSCA